MSERLSTSIVTLLLVLLGAAAPSVASGQTAEADADPPSESAASSEAETAAERGRVQIDAARKARDEGRYGDALDAIGRAQFEEPDNGLYIYERVLTLEAMGEYDLALELVEDQRDTLIKHPDINDLVVVEERITQKAGQSAEESVSEDELVAEETSPANRPVLGYVLTGTGSVLVTGAGILFLIQSDDRSELSACSLNDPNCAPREFDRRTDRVNTLRTISIATGVVGLGMVGWGVYELLTQGSPTEEAQDSRVSVTPFIGDNAGGITFGGSF